MLTAGLAAAIACCGFAQATESLSATDRMLGTNGTDLRDRHGKGEVVRLRGVNLGAWLKFEAWMCPVDTSKALLDVNPGHNGYDFQVRRLLTSRFGAATAAGLINAYKDAWITEADLDHIKALGFNAVRLPFCYDHLLHEDGSWRDDAFKHIDWLVGNAAKRGIYTILDYHGFLPPGANENGSENGYFSIAEQKAETVRIWSRIAARYRANPAVAMYDLLNEPTNSAPEKKPAPAPATVNELYDQIYQAIRRVDPDHIIAMEGMWGWDTLRDPHQAGYHNVVCSLHWYHWGNGMTTEKHIAATRQEIDGVKKMFGLWKIPCYVGEFNLFGDRAAWTDALQEYDRAGLSWTMWSYKNRLGGTNSWGLCGPVAGRNPPIPDLTKDSADEIRRKWMTWKTNDRDFAINPFLEPLLRQSKP